MRILWSPQSLRDLDAIHEYIAKDSERYAGLTIARPAVRRSLGEPKRTVATLLRLLQP